MSQERVVLIAGASGGIGRAAAAKFAGRGDRLALQYRSNPGPVLDLIASLPEGQAVSIQADLTESKSLHAMVDEVIDHYGSIDAFVNTVGTTSKYERFLKMTDDAIEWTIDVELRSIIYSTRAVVETMVAAGKGGQIVVIGSDSGKVGTTGEAVSAACRAGIIGFAKSIAREHARDNILMNVICPGPVRTGLWDQVLGVDQYSGSIGEKLIQATPLRRIAEPDEIADAIVFLSTPASSFITGQAISVSGGLTMVS